ncbi:permease prefix domain 1-containing protein [Isoptericola sp. NPDC057191]|uniref:permease prefix domain 1-containing protein n=1 Tax=Isoptericola sp. NPDC057191 TaxID=3346041 RepID=UPI0036404F4B
MTTVHRLLDDAFAGVEPSPEVQDLKEEIRANLEARAAELQAGGVTPDDAARRAFDELGDVRALVADAQADVAAQTGGAPRTPMQEAFAVAQQQRVRPKPRFVLGVVLASLVFVALVAVAVLAALDVVALPAVVVAAFLLTASSAAGFVVGSSLSQETTTNHPMPSRRAGGYYLATGLTVFALLLAAFVPLGVFASWVYVVAAGLFVVGGVLFTMLGVTQTNRKKAWVRDVARAHVSGHHYDRFEHDPVAAARFGVYTVVIWLVAFVVFVVLGITVGWAWSWLTFVVALAVMMLVLARMLFMSQDERPHDQQ